MKKKKKSKNKLRFILLVKQIFNKRLKIKMKRTLREIYYAENLPYLHVQVNE